MSHIDLLTAGCVGGVCVFVSSVNIDETPSFHLLQSCFVRVFFLCPFRGLNRAVLGAKEMSSVVGCRRRRLHSGKKKEL
jgi:hypothetical protein